MTSLKANVATVGSEPVSRGKGWYVLVVVVCAVVGLLLATTRAASHGSEIRTSDSARLSDLVRTARDDTVAAQHTRDDLAAQVQALQSATAESDAEVADVLAQAGALDTAAGLVPLNGRGVVVTLTDASRDAAGNYPADATPDDLVVHQQDVQSVLNALWAGGAEAIRMQDQRITMASAPRCIGNTLLLHGRTYSPPYVMAAVGNPDTMIAALESEPGVRTFRQYAARFGLGFAVEVNEAVTVPGYDGAVTARYAQPGS